MGEKSERKHESTVGNDKHVARKKRSGTPLVSDHHEALRLGKNCDYESELRRLQI